MNIREIAFTGYPVTNMTRARAFYEGVFGLKVSAKFEHEGRTWLEYDIGPGTLALSDMSPNWKPSADGPSIALEMENFNEAIAELRAARVQFLIEPMDTGVCQLAIVADPEGNSVAIHRRKST